MEKSFSRFEVLDLEEALNMVLKQDVPCKYAFIKTLKKVTKINKDTLSKRHDIFMKHVKKDEKDKPVIKEGSQPGATGYLITDHVFEKEQDFVTEMNEMLGEKVDVEVHMIDLKAPVIIAVKQGDLSINKEYTLEQYLDASSQVSELTVSLVEDVFVK